MLSYIPLEVDYCQLRHPTKRVAEFDSCRNGRLGDFCYCGAADGHLIREHYGRYL